MSIHKKSIKLDPSEKLALERLYLDRKIATDRYQHRPKDLVHLTEDFNILTSRSDSPQEILHYMRTKRKAGKWPRLNGSHRRLSVLLPDFDEELIPALIHVYKTIGVAVDNFGHDRKLAAELEHKFMLASGVRIPGLTLATVLMELRKDSKLPKLGKQHDDGFHDLDAAAAM